jgi:hypothetical protein
MKKSRITVMDSRPKVRYDFDPNDESMRVRPETIRVPVAATVATNQTIGLDQLAPVQHLQWCRQHNKVVGYAPADLHPRWCTAPAGQQCGSCKYKHVDGQ